jgi:CBS domain-containing protein
MQPEYLEEELERLSEAPDRVLSRESFMLPIENLFSKPALTIDVSEPVSRAITLMRESEYGAVAVTREGKLAGLLTERLLICNVIGVIDNYEQRRAGDVMRPDPIALQREDPIIHALHNMQVGGYRHIPIVDDQQRPVSVVSIKDVVRFILSHFADDVHNVTPVPFRGTAPREGP